MSIYNQKDFILSKDSPSKSFTLEYPFSTIKISKIILDSHFGMDHIEWGKAIRNLMLLFKTINTEDTSEVSFLVNLAAQVTPNHQFPVFEVNIEFPQSNIGNTNSLRNFFNKVEISIKDSDEISEDITLIVVYEQLPGLRED